MPRRIQISFADHLPGTNDPENGIYQAIARSYPALDLTKANSSIISIVPAEDRLHPYQACVVVQKGGADNRFTFFYDRTDLSTLLRGIVFTPVEQATMQAFTTDEQFYIFLEKKTQHPFNWRNVWLDGNYIRYTGGNNHPNFRVKATDASIYYRGQKIISFTANQSPD